MRYLLLCLLLSGCAQVPAAPQKPVRLLAQADPACKFIGQESCTMRGDACDAWHRSNAANSGANAMHFIQYAERQVATIMLTPTIAAPATKTTIVADYYDCP